MQQGYESYVGTDEATADKSYKTDNQQTVTQPDVGSTGEESEKVKVEISLIYDDLTDGDKDTLCKIFVGNIPRHVMDDEFRSYFEDKVPSIKDVFVMKDMQNPTQNRGFGFLSLYTIEDVDTLLMGQKLSFNGRPLDIKRASPKDCDDPLLHIKTNRIFLGGLSPVISEDDISEYYESRFGQSGKPIEVIIKKDRNTNKPRGFCFVVFQNEHIVDKVMLLERKPTICGKRLDVRKADATGSQFREYKNRMNPNSAVRRGAAMQAAMTGYGPMGGFNNRRGRQMMNMPINAAVRGRGGADAAYMNRGNFSGPVGPGIQPMMAPPHYQPYYSRNQYPGQAPVAGGAIGDPTGQISMAYGASAASQQQAMQGSHDSMYSSYMQQASGVAAGQMPAASAYPGTSPATTAPTSTGINQGGYAGSVAGGAPPQGGNVRYQ